MGIKQDIDFTLEVETQTVGWLVNNTMIKKFTIIDGNMSGYQRNVNEKHLNKIVDYIKDYSFYFPSCIVCCIPKDENDLLKLKENGKQYFVVDGQHRIEAFKRIQRDEKELYERIKNYAIPVTLLRDVSTEVEISTFITINKTGRKVDTSLAYLLRNKIKHLYKEDLTAVADYYSVELALTVNEMPENIWYNQIALEGSAKENNCFITLNSFVIAYRRLAKKLMRLKIIDESGSDESKETNKEIFNIIWKAVQEEWSDLFEDDGIYNTVIMGSIGFSSITKYIVNQLNHNMDVIDQSNIYEFIRQWITNISVPSKYWKKGSVFSRYTSESGYSEIADMLEKKGIVNK